jgi:hypothetical protein
MSAPVPPTPPGPSRPSKRATYALGGMFVLAAVATWLAGEPSGLLVFLAVFLGGGVLLGWVDATPR